MLGYLILETGQAFQGVWNGGQSMAGEVVFNTSHSGYEEIATDPSYFSQILVMSAPMQGNYGADHGVWESHKVHIKGFVCLEMQKTLRDQSWLEQLFSHQIPVMTEVNTRSLILTLRDQGTVWGALVCEAHLEKAQAEAEKLIGQAQGQEMDWPSLVSVKEAVSFRGLKPQGPRLAVLDFGCKRNILEELKKRSREICVFPSHTCVEEIQNWNPEGLLLSNGPGNPSEVLKAPETIRQLLGKLPIFGICMGHQILALALGMETFKLKFGHRGSNHPIKDELLDKIYISAQNHGYAVKMTDSIKDKNIQITHTNLNDQTIAGIFSEEYNVLGVQFHPESHPGPHDSETLFDFFVDCMVRRRIGLS